MIRLIYGPALAAGLCLLVGACDGGASAVPVQKTRAVDVAPAPTLTSSDGPAETARPSAAGRAAVPTLDGRPMWSATRRFTAEQNARRAYDRNGAAFDARSVDAFVRKTHAFVSKPPRGALTFQRGNGDTLIYDPAGNVFAIVTREGAPRTMFKPDEGMAYWEKVKAQEAARTTTRRTGGGIGEEG